MSYAYIRAEAQYHSALLKVTGYTSSGEPLVGDFFTQEGSFSLEEALSPKMMQGRLYYVVNPKSVKYEKLTLKNPYKPWYRGPSLDNLQLTYDLSGNGATLDNKVIKNGQSLDWSRQVSVHANAGENQIVKNCSFLGNNGAGVGFFNSSNFKIKNCTFVDCCRKTEDVGYFYCWGRNGATGGVIEDCAFLSTSKIRKGRDFGQDTGPYKNSPFGAWVYGAQIDDNRSDVRINNCHFDGMTVGIVVNGGTRITIDSCVFGPRLAKHLWVIGGGDIEIINCPTFNMEHLLHQGKIPTIKQNGIVQILPTN